MASLWDRNLSSGDMTQSANARPIPEINISMPEFTLVPLTKGWLQVRGDFADVDNKNVLPSPFVCNLI